MHNEFEKEERYKLYRKVEEILHPTISKKNISDYKIIIGEDLLPIRVFYPKKVSNIKDVIIYVHGDSRVTNCSEKYSEISSELAKELDKLVVSIDYDENDEVEAIYKDVESTYKYIYDKLIDNGITKDNITLVGDSTGGAIVLSFVDLCPIDRCLLFYPVLSGEYFGKTNYNSIIENNKIDHDLVYKLKEYYNGLNDNKKIFPLLNKKKKYPKTLLLIGNVDPLIDEVKDFSDKNDKVELEIVAFANHGFLNTNDMEIKKEYYGFIHKFME